MVNKNNGQILCFLNSCNWIEVYKSYVQQHSRDELGNDYDKFILLV